MTTDTSNPPTARTEIALSGWLLVASAFGASGVVSVEHPLAVPLFLFGSLAAMIVLHRSHGGFRRAVEAIPTSSFTALHVLRAPIGAAFVLLGMEGRLDPEFAFLAGPGDVVAGLLAFFALPFAASTSAGARRVVAVAHGLGLLDIVAVVVTAQRILLFSGHPETMGALTGLPGALIPTFLVPLVIASHLCALARLRRAARP